jgi:N-hydroxyarylamine O-acetyltransferase
MSDVNLNAYFERVGFAGSIAPNLTTLEALHSLHPAAIPFENLDPLLGRPVLLDQKSLEQKLLADGRGGYCLEHNFMFMRVLRELDYSVRGLAARVLWNRPEDEAERPASHMVLAVDIGGSTYLADVGFGGITLTAPLRLRADVEQATPHESFRLVNAGAGMRLEVRLGEEDWRPVYAFDPAPASEPDFAAINAFVETTPQFRETLMAARAEKERRLALHDTRYTVYPLEGERESRVLTSIEELAAILSGPFGISLPPAAEIEPVLQRILDKSQPEAATGGA